MGFMKPDKMEMPEPVRTPTKSRSEITEAAAEARRRKFSKTPGVAATLLTGGFGAPSGGGSFGSASLFGS